MPDQNPQNTADVLASVGAIAVAAPCLKHTAHGGLHLVTTDVVDYPLIAGASGRVQR